MNPLLLTPPHVIVQGITGAHGSFHTRQMLALQVPIIGGTSKSHIRETIEGVTVYESVAAIQDNSPIDASIIFVPPTFARAAVFEAIKARVALIIIITEGIPLHDMLDMKAAGDQAGCRIIGPNCPGILLPDRICLGIIPKTVGLPGSIGLVSRSGTLTYEAAAALSARGLGQRAIIGIGGDSIQGTNFVDCLMMFEEDPEVDKVVLIGEIGGKSERDAADFIKAKMKKPVYAYIAGHSAPPNVQLGHAGAILGSVDESATAKTTYLQQAGAITANSLHQLITLVR